MEKDIQDKEPAFEGLEKTHLIIGAGNLGLDLEIALKEKGERVHIYSAHAGLDALNAEQLKSFISRPYSVIWCCVGAGSIDFAKTRPLAARAMHLMLPEYILRTSHDESRSVFFSSDYCAHEKYPSDPHKSTPQPKSYYAELKRSMEEMVEDSCLPRVTVVRVSSLYGRHKPQDTFPGRILQRRKEIAISGVPDNRVCPTPTDWLAKKLATNFDQKGFFSDEPMIHHCAPKSSTTTRDWANDVLGPEYAYTGYHFMDEERPFKSGLLCSFEELKGEDHWGYLWSERGWRWKAIDKFEKSFV